MKKLFLLNSIVTCGAIALMMLSSCVPPSVETTEPAKTTTAPAKAPADHTKCDLYLSFAYSYYQNQNWKAAIENYQKMVDHGCEADYAQDIFIYYGRAYQQLAAEDPKYLDSALYIYQRGEKYLPKDLYLRKYIAYIYRLQNKTDLEIREYEKMLEISPEDLEIHRNLAKLYFNSQRWNDVIYISNEILKLSPQDEQAKNDLILAYQKLGKNPIDILRDTWEKSPSVRSGLEYANALKQGREYDKALQVYQKVTQIDARNLEAWQNLADLYQSQNKLTEAISAYEYISKNLAPRDLDIIQKICQNYIKQANFPAALTWADKAVSLGGAQAYKIRGDLYYNAADYFLGSEKITFEDKLVYKLAYDDYKKAFELGDQSLKTRLDHLKEYLIPTTEEWFFNRFDAQGKQRTSYRPNKPCYNWITTEVKKD